MTIFKEIVKTRVSLNSLREHKVVHRRANLGTVSVEEEGMRGSEELSMR